MKRGKEKRRKKRTKRRRSKDDGRVVFLLRPLTFLVKVKIQRAVVIFPGMASWVSLMTCLIVSLFLVSWCMLCLM